MARQFHRPLTLDPADAEKIVGTEDPASTSELAHRSAQILVGGFPTEPETDHPAASVLDSPDELTREVVVTAVAAQGVDAVAELWADSPATTLPGTLWRLLLVREWVRRDPELIARRYATTVDLQTADEAEQARLDAALAQATPVPSPTQVQETLDRALDGNLSDGLPELAQICLLAARFLEHLAAGSSAVWIEDDADELADQVTRRESALLLTAQELAAAAVRAHSGNLD